MRRVSVAVALVWAGCSTLPSTPRDAGPRDRVTADTTPVRVDTDRDGLCDETERSRRTDPARADTDGDGLLDSYEVLTGTNPLTITDPPASRVLTVSEGSGSLVTSEQFVPYYGTNGEVVSAAVLDRGPGLDGRFASAWESAVEAVSADPAAFVRGWEGARFLGVLGRVDLHWRVTVRSPEGVALGCRRAYELLFVVKREGDQVVFAEPLTLDVTPSPSGPALDGGTPWPASPEGMCLPDTPCE